VQEAIYSLLMMENDFIAASANVESLDEGADGMDVVQEPRSDVRLNRVMSNSFGFGGTNATLVFQRFEG
jgi:3-oxoacyl-[acyl-carrier-protein] synthase-1